ncbi:hypothetical protein PROFUN_02031 [Planoprotostelium fungivorum]|uniref:DNA/RNA-binding protein Alba-like domain-containing protein n=1 Tax=Planoprotostelium fungivorum TaxID=1890364 RepID=A0A2P6NB75_9EUKA|nr:hypothetical protein PROFUN_02031 [Planoprotostelium fungivorum]
MEEGGDSTTEKYVRLNKIKTDTQAIKNEIRVTSQGKTRNYISYASALLTGADDEPQHEQVILKAMGRAINKAVSVAEILKRRVPLHQVTTIDSSNIVDVWEPIEEGLDRIETTRHVSSITIVLSTQPLDVNEPGYQPPLPAEEIKPFTQSRGGRGRVHRGRGQRGSFRGRGRGSDDHHHQSLQAPATSQDDEVEYEDDEDEPSRPPERPFRGRGRGGFRGGPPPRGGRGRGRGRGDFRGDYRGGRGGDYRGDYRGGRGQGQV